uniref:Acyltransferase n=1 Tax=Strigamia maritima TaxID=126957 RepID=T1J2Z3_STRMM
MNVYFNPESSTIDNSLTMSSNFTFNSTSEYEDPIVLWLNAITLPTALNYTLIGVYIILFILIALPIIGIVLFFLINYGGSFVIYLVYRIKYRLKNGKSGLDRDEAREAILTWWYWVAKIWFGYQVIGSENIPVHEATIGVFTHGQCPVFAGGLSAFLIRVRKAPYAVVIDKNHGNAPIIKDFASLFNMSGWTREECIKFLQEGTDVITLPGGRHEVFYSDSNYELDWGKRNGYAKLAKATKATILPGFCMNLQEACWVPFFLKPFVNGRFASKKFPIVVGWGCLPVKLVTILGPTIQCDESKTVDDIANETLDAVRKLRDTYQRLPGNKFYALLDRFRTIKYKTNFATI